MAKAAKPQTLDAHTITADLCERFERILSELRAAGDGRSTAELERVALWGALGKVETPPGSPAGIRVVAHLATRRSRDRDNNSAKALVDCLRYSGLLQNDNEATISLEVVPIKVSGKTAVESTVIEIFFEPTHSPVTEVQKKLAELPAFPL